MDNEEQYRAFRARMKQEEEDQMMAGFDAGFKDYDERSGMGRDYGEGKYIDGKYCTDRELHEMAERKARDAKMPTTKAKDNRSLEQIHADARAQLKRPYGQ